MKPLTEQHRPRTLAELIGQPVAVRMVSAKLKTKSSFAVICSGEPGIGKTSLAYAIAGELGVDTENPASGFRLVPSNRQGVDALDELFTQCHCTPMTGGWHILLFEESDCKSRQAVNYLKTRLERLPDKTVCVFTTNATLAEFTEPAIHERCLCLRFEHDAGKLAGEAQALVSRVWETTLGHNHAPTLAELGIADTGRLSFRRVLNALEPVLLAEMPAEGLEEPTTQPAANSPCPPETPTTSPPVAPLFAHVEPENAVAGLIGAPEAIPEPVPEPAKPSWLPSVGDTVRTIKGKIVKLRERKPWGAFYADDLNYYTVENLQPIEGMLI